VRETSPSRWGSALALARSSGDHSFASTEIYRAPPRSRADRLTPFSTTSSVPLPSAPQRQLEIGSLWRSNRRSVARRANRRHERRQTAEMAKLIADLAGRSLPCW